MGKIVEIKEEKDGGTLILAVSRTFKNEEGLYDKDDIPIKLDEGFIKNIKEYCKTNDTVGVKGRLQMIDNTLTIVAEKITFLSSGKKEGEE